MKFHSTFFPIKENNFLSRNQILNLWQNEIRLHNFSETSYVVPCSIDPSWFLKTEFLQAIFSPMRMTSFLREFELLWKKKSARQLLQLRRVLLKMRLPLLRNLGKPPSAERVMLLYMMTIESIHPRHLKIINP